MRAFLNDRKLEFTSPMDSWRGVSSAGVGVSAETERPIARVAIEERARMVFMSCLVWFYSA